MAHYLEIRFGELEGIVTLRDVLDAYGVGPGTRS